MVMIRRKTHVRSTSTPVDDFEPSLLDDAPLQAHRTRLVSNAALDDSDALTAASRRHDQQVMHDINSRLANVSFSPPSPVLHRRARHYSPPPITILRKPPLPTAHATVVTSLKMTSEPTVDSDVNHDVDLMMPLTSRVLLRGGSVPPVPSSSVLLAEAGCSGPTVVKTRVVQNGPHVVRVERPSTFVAAPVEHVKRTHYVVQTAPSVPESFYYHPQSAAHLTPTADQAVRHAHRNLDRIEHELKTDMTLAPPITPLPAVKTYATVDLGPRRRSSSYHGPVSGVTSLRARSVSPVGLYSARLPVHSYDSCTMPTYYGTVHTYPEGKITTTTTSKKEILSSEPSFYPTYHTTKTEYHRPLSASFPVSQFSTSDISPPAHVLAATTGDIEAIISSARTLPEVTTKTHTVEPVRSTYHPSPVVTSTAAAPVSKPKISETRKRVRDVLCKVKGDPHYFDV